MSGILMEVSIPLTARRDNGMPLELREVIEHHLDGLVGLPTPEIVEAICKEPVAVFHKEKVLRYFLLQSPLRPRDLPSICASIGSKRVVVVSREVRNDREYRLRGGWKPRWREGTPS